MKQDHIEEDPINEEESMLLDEEIDPDYEPTEQEIYDYAEYLGMDLQNDKKYLYIAKEGLKAPLPDPWKPYKNRKNEIYYINVQNNNVVYEHPCDSYYKKKFLDTKMKERQQQSKNTIKAQKEQQQQQIKQQYQQAQQAQNDQSSQQSLIMMENDSFCAANSNNNNLQKNVQNKPISKHVKKQPIPIDLDAFQKQQQEFLGLNSIKNLPNQMNQQQANSISNIQKSIVFPIEKQQMQQSVTAADNSLQNSLDFRSQAEYEFSVMNDEFLQQLQQYRKERLAVLQELILSSNAEFQTDSKELESVHNENIAALKAKVTQGKQLKLAKITEQKDAITKNLHQTLQSEFDGKLKEIQEQHTLSKTNADELAKSKLYLQVEEMVAEYDRKLADGKKEIEQKKKIIETEGQRHRKQQQSLELRCQQKFGQVQFDLDRMADKALSLFKKEEAESKDRQFKEHVATLSQELSKTGQVISQEDQANKCKIHSWKAQLIQLFNNKHQTEVEAQQERLNNQIKEKEKESQKIIAANIAAEEETNMTKQLNTMRRQQEQDRDALLHTMDLKKEQIRKEIELKYQNQKNALQKQQSIQGKPVRHKSQYQQQLDEDRIVKQINDKQQEIRKLEIANQTLQQLINSKQKIKEQICSNKLFASDIADIGQLKQELAMKEKVLLDLKQYQSQKDTLAKQIKLQDNKSYISQIVASRSVSPNIKIEADLLNSRTQNVEMARLQKKVDAEIAAIKRKLKQFEIEKEKTLKSRVIKLIERKIIKQQ